MSKDAGINIFIFLITYVGIWIGPAIMYPSYELVKNNIYKHLPQNFTLPQFDHNMFKSDGTQSKGLDLSEENEAGFFKASGNFLSENLEKFIIPFYYKMTDYSHSMK